MARPLSTEIVTELEANAVSLAILVKLTFNGTAIYLWTGYNDLSWDGHTWQGNGWLQSVSEYKEDQQLATTTLEIELTAASSEVNSLLLSEIQHSDTAEFYIAFLNASGAIISSPYKFFSGPVDECTINDASDYTTATLTYLSDLCRMDEAPGLRYSDQAQKTLYPGDTGFRYVPKLDQWTYYWGKATIPKNTRDKKKKTTTDRRRTLTRRKTPSKGPKIIWRAPGVYRRNGKLIHIGKPPSINQSTSKKKIKRTEITGKEVTVRSSDENRRIVVGRVKTGGLLSFLDTSSDSCASKTTGSGNNQIAWIARASGIAGNNTSVEIICTGTQAAIAVTVVGTDISVRVKSSSGTSQSTANQVIAAVRADSAANALVAVHNGDGDGTDLVQAEGKESLSGGGGTWLYNYITLAGHQIAGIDKLFLGKDEITFGASPDPRWATGKYANKVFMAKVYGSPTQPAQSDLMTQLPSKWTENDRQCGCAGMTLILVWDAYLFPEGWPDIYVEERGMLCYNPRTGLTAWTQNAALIIANYLTNTEFGCKVPWSEIDTDTLAQAETICDQQVDKLGGGTEARYTIDGFFDMGRTRRSVLEDFEQSIAGNVIRSGSKWYILPGVYREPTFTLTEDDARGEIQVTALKGRADTFNRIKGTYANSLDDYTATDFPSVTNATYLDEDGGELWEEMSFPFINSSSRCQRIAKIFLEKNRQCITVSFVASLRALQLMVGDTVSLTLAKYGWSSKPFEVVSLELDIDTEDGLVVNLLLNETAAGCYDWNSGEETQVDPAPDSNLPDPFTVESPENLTLTSGTSELYIRDDGTVFSRLKVSYAQPSDEFVFSGGKVEIQHKRSSNTDWSSTTEISGDLTFYHILDVQDGVAYDVRIRNKNGIGVVSEWVAAYNHTVIGKTEPPANVQGFTATFDQFGVLLNWTAIPDVDVSHYELRWGPGWEADNFIAETQGTNHRLGIQIAGDYSFSIKAFDTSGNESITPTEALLTITAPSMPNVAFSFAGQNTVLSWDEPSSVFAIDHYEISYGNSYIGSTPVTSVRGTTFSLHTDWPGARRFWVAAVDVAGNVGAAGSVDATVILPSQPADLSSAIVDNNVLLRWSPSSAGSLPVLNYNVYKGATFAGAESVGQVGGTFAAIFEIVSGTFTYWVTAMDSAGNESTEASITCTVDQPPDFILRSDLALDFSTFTTKTNVTFDGLQAVLPTVSETWNQHFTNNSWTTIQAQIDAGFPYYLQPSASTAQLINVFDYGAIIEQGTLITLSYLLSNIVGTVTLTPKIAYSPDNSSWTEETGVLQVYASHFRYVRITLDATRDSNHALATLENGRLILNVKEQTDEGSGEIAVGSEATGASCTFNKEFVDITSLIPTAYYDSGHPTWNPIRAIADFTDVPNPTSFTVYLYKADGTKCSGRFSWIARGV